MRRKPTPNAVFIHYDAVVAPLAMIVVQGGVAVTTRDQRILDIEPTSLHQRVPLIIGSSQDVAQYQDFWKKG